AQMNRIAMNSDRCDLPVCTWRSRGASFSKLPPGRAVIHFGRSNVMVPSLPPYFPTLPHRRDNLAASVQLTKPSLPPLRAALCLGNDNLICRRRAGTKRVTELLASSLDAVCQSERAIAAECQPAGKEIGKSIQP